MLLFLLAAAAGILVLQVFLSRRESGWLGLLLPAVSFVGALLPVLGMLFFGVAGANGARVWIGGTEIWTGGGDPFPVVQSAHRRSAGDLLCLPQGTPQ